MLLAVFALMVSVTNLIVVLAVCSSARRAQSELEARLDRLNRV